MAAAAIVNESEQELLTAWLSILKSGRADHRLATSRPKAHAGELVKLIPEALTHNRDVESAAWKPVRRVLEVSATAPSRDFRRAETATFIFSLKKPLFELRLDLGNDPVALGDAVWEVTEVVDPLGMHTIKTFQKAHEAVINRQQDELLRAHRRAHHF